MRLSAYPVLIVVGVVLVALGLGGYAYTVMAQAQPASFRLSEAHQQGTFNVGTAHATLARVSDPDTGAKVLKLNYRVFSGTVAGAWTNGLSGTPDANSAEVARMRFRLSETESAGQVAVALEIKGTHGTQRIPLELHSGWNTLEQAVDWRAIGKPNEAVVAVSRIGDGEPVAGTLSFDVAFGTQSWLQKLSLLPAMRMAVVLLLGLLFAGMAAIPERFIRYSGRRDQAIQLNIASRTRTDEASWGGYWRRDFVLGVAVVAIVTIAISIYYLGGQGRLAVASSVLAVAVAGVLLGEWAKYGLTGRHLTSAEAFQDLVVSGLLAASASSLSVLQAPNGWSNVLLLSSLVAAAAALVYHAANVHRLATAGRHLGTVAGTLIAGAPYVVGSLLLLGSTSLLAGWPVILQTLGRVLVVFGFNEAMANGLAMATQHKMVRAWQTHLAMLIAAAAVIVAPWIANLGSGELVASFPTPLAWLAILATTVLSQAGLWAEVYLITGMLLDAIHGNAPSPKAAIGNSLQGMKKGMIYGGVFMGILCGLDLLAGVPGVAETFQSRPLIAALLLGTLAFPLAKALIETFDGSQGFFRRVAKSYRSPILYLRGAVAGAGLGYAFSHAMAEQTTLGRAGFGFAVGLAASAGVSVLRDAVQRGRLQSWRLYLVHAALGGLIGAGLGFYLDATQVSLVVGKFHRYLSVGQAPEAFDVYPLLSKWGYIPLGKVTGGVTLLFNEALMGVISWSIPAWLFAINRTFMSAYFRRETAPITALFTKHGLLALAENTIVVFRWGLWMSPIIASFLRPMADPTWYNQDGAIRTGLSAFHYLTSSPEVFRAWSLGVFISLLAYDGVRILIWLDHMGLRVATLVNLSFLGMDKLDQRLARFLGPAATAHCIPESVKRFATWAPLLIPFYIPRGSEWDQAWSRAEAMQAAAGPGWLAGLFAMPLGQGLLLLGAAVAASTVLFTAIRWIKSRRASQHQTAWTIRNGRYEVVLKENGEIFSRAVAQGYDVSRRSYDLLDPAGRTLFVVDPTCKPHDAARGWSVLGNLPRRQPEPPQIEQNGEALRIRNTSHGIQTTIDVALAGNDPAELWTITVENLTDRERPLKLVPYLEWVLNRPESDRGHTQYNRLFPEMEYVDGLHAVLAWHKHSKAMGLLAVDAAPEGYLTSRIDFIGRAQSIASPRVLQTLAFSTAGDTGAHPTFDPIGSLLVDASLKPGQSAQFRLLLGLTEDKEEAIELIARHLEIPGADKVSPARKRETSHPVRHGEILPGTPQPYSEYSEDGRTLRVHTPFTPRPFDHTMSNALGHVMVVTNRGLHTTSNGNSQQNRLTPDWADIVTREVPGEAFYLYDVDARQWFSPTYHPLNDAEATYEVEFGVDGTATYRMRRETLATELTAFVPPDEPTGVYLLTVRNLDDVTRQIRMAPYFQMVLADQPEHAGPLKVHHDRRHGVLYFENPRSAFRTGPAFVAMSAVADCVETQRGRFFGADGDVTRPYMVEYGTPDSSLVDDERPIAALLATLEIPPRGQCTVTVVLGQADDRTRAEAIVEKYLAPQSARAGLAGTRQWWLALMNTIRVDTGQTDVDRYLDWLKYQTLAERIWARRGFYQASGAYGFRDQLQDSVNLIWMDPVLARRQIVLHSAQQFLEGDVVHWFHLLQDGRTGFAARTYASDNLLWLAWATVEYVGLTGDESILDEQTPYLEAEQPLPPLPAGKHGLGFVPLRSSRIDSVYQHCLRAIDLVLEHRIGAHGLPLIGTGDWNDGLDEIGSQGRGESVWLGFFLHCILQRISPIVGHREGRTRSVYYMEKASQLEHALQSTWRDDRYLRAIHDDGTEIGVRGSGIWEIDALTAAWAVMSGIDPQRGRIVFDTAIRVLEKDNTILLGSPPLREDTKPYLGRSSWYPEGVRENGMYCHGVQWLVGAARLLAEQCQRDGELDDARRYAQTAYRLWRKTSPLSHVTAEEIETYGGQPNKQAADLVTALDPGRMGWHGYTGAAGWLFRQALEGVLGMRLEGNQMIAPIDQKTVGPLESAHVSRDVSRSSLGAAATGKSPQVPAPAGPLLSAGSKPHGTRVETRT